MDGDGGGVGMGCGGDGVRMGWGWVGDGVRMGWGWGVDGVGKEVMLYATGHDHRQCYLNVYMDSAREAGTITYYHVL